MRYRFGDFALDTERYELWQAGTLVKLQPKVFEVLTYLLAHRERLVSKQELLEQCWPRQFISEATLSSCIRAVRRAVGDSGQAQRVIQTLHRRGFRFVAELDEHWQERQERLRLPQPARSGPLEPLGTPVADGSSMTRDDHEPDTCQDPTTPVVDAEYKPVTVLSAGLVPPTASAVQLGPEVTHGLMQACLTTAQQVLRPYGGTLTHITSEGFVVLFGAPRAQEDHARRAVLASVALQQALQACQEGVSPSVPLSIGLHTGPVVVGGLGAESTRLYTPVGETFELANRLRQRAAPGEILLSAPIQRLVHAEIQVEDAEAIGVAGDAAPLPVYRVCGIMRRGRACWDRGDAP